MTTTLAPEARRNVALYSVDYSGIRPRFSYKRNNSGKQVLSVAGMPVFRSGVFRDSMGFQHTWEPIHMDQMVQHFDLLRARHLLPDIPVRDGHPGFLMSGTPGTGKVVGWHESLKVEERTSPTDGALYSYLLADYEILDEDAQQAIEKGLWRNRSAEVGTYITNAEAEFWPVYMGVAYVDLGAVEGLNGFSNPNVGKSFSIMFEKETPVGTEGTPAAGTTETPVTPPVEPTPPPPPPPPAEGEENENKEGEGTPPAPPVTPPVSPPAAPPIEHSMFRVNGAQIGDYAAVQRHIDSLEKFRDDTVVTGRQNFVKQLATENKILGSQVTQLETFALTLTEEQWAQWTASWDAAPAQSLLGDHGRSADNLLGSGTPAEKKAERIEILEGVVRQHKLSGMSQELIEKTASYLELQTLKANA